MSDLDFDQGRRRSTFCAAGIAYFSTDEFICTLSSHIIPFLQVAAPSLLCVAHAYKRRDRRGLHILADRFIAKKQFVNETAPCGASHVLLDCQSFLPNRQSWSRWRKQDEVIKMCFDFPDQERLAKREPTVVLEFSPSKKALTCMIHSKSPKEMSTSTSSAGHECRMPRCENVLGKGFVPGIKA